MLPIHNISNWMPDLKPPICFVWSSIIVIGHKLDGTHLSILNKNDTISLLHKVTTQSNFISSGQWWLSPFFEMVVILYNGNSKSEAKDLLSGSNFIDSPFLLARCWSPQSAGIACWNCFSVMQQVSCLLPHMSILPNWRKNSNQAVSLDLLYSWCLLCSLPHTTYYHPVILM